MRQTCRSYIDIKAENPLYSRHPDMKLKTHKALSKRIKITKTGKMMKRYGGQDHFNSRDTGNAGRKKRTDHPLSTAYAKSVKSLIPNT